MNLLSRISSRFIFILLIVALILGGTACSSVNSVDTNTISESTSTLTTTVNDAESNTFMLSSDYVLVRPRKSTGDEIEAANFISRGLNAITGFNLKLTTDHVKPGEEVEPAEFEILIGPTNRTHSQAKYNSLLRLDYGYEIINKNAVVIYGGSPQATLLAARAFMKDIFGYEENKDLSDVISFGENAALTIGATFFFENDYPVKTLKIGGVPVTEFSIYSVLGHDKAAEMLVKTVADLCGYNIPVLNKSEYKPGAPTIFLGCSDPDGNHLDLVFDNYTYYITAKEGSVPNLIIDTTAQFARKEAVEGFATLYLSNVKPGDEVDIPISYTCFTGYALGREGNKLQLSKLLNEKTIAPGITYMERLYKDQDDKPIRAYVLTISPDSGRLYTGTPDDGDVLLNMNGTVLDEMNAAVANGHKVIAGVNADFFEIKGNYLPRGLCIKEGKVLRENTSRPWFGVLYDGTYVIGEPTHYNKYKDQLQTAVGGHYIILSNGKISNIGLGNEFGYTRHPRTAVGYNADGMLVLLVVDGRQSDLSNGASLGDLAGILRELGCTDALNLDGGGSSTFIIDDGSGSFKTMNSPSDGKLRKIQNSLLVLLPD